MTTDNKMLNAMELFPHIFEASLIKSNSTVLVVPFKDILSEYISQPKGGIYNEKNLKRIIANIGHPYKLVEITDGQNGSKQLGIARTIPLDRKPLSFEDNDKLVCMTHPDAYHNYQKHTKRLIRRAKKFCRA